LSRTYDQIENMLLTREQVVVALPKGHSAARKKYVGLRDLEGELLIVPSKDLFPSLYQMFATAFLKSHSAGEISNGGTFSAAARPVVARIV
jgi:DNA-binding transcriptional LysR family regulator